MTRKITCQNIKDLVSSNPESAKDLPSEFEEHVKQCIACQAEVRASRRLVAMLQTAGSTFKPSFTMDQLAQRAINAPQRRHSKAVWLRPVIGFAVAASIAAVVIALWPGKKPAGPAKSNKNIVKQDVMVLKVASLAKFKGKVRTQMDSLEVKTLKTAKGEKILATLSDSTKLWVNEGSVVEFTDKNRTITVPSGEILLDVVKQKGLKPFVVDTPSGRVNVTGTRLSVASRKNYAIVDVLRGHIIVESGKTKAPVTAGGEAVLRKDLPPMIHASSNPGYAAEWANETADRYTGVSGFGTLKARKPGEKKDSELALRMVDHKVKVMIQGRIVRTEVEEEFQNDLPATMEGIYNFPLPHDAKIAALDLVVDGKWEHGAIVEKSRGDKIWAGVIRNAAPKKKKQEIVEYVWVPGPWHDPALLNWKKGNQFELKIFPIPGKGSRRVRIAYTQVLSEIPGGHRYVLPMVGSESKKPVTERFRFEAMIGNAPVDEIRVSPLEMDRKTTGKTAVLSYDGKDFMPTADLVIDIPAAKPHQEITAWSFRNPMKTQDEAYGLIALKPVLADYSVPEKLEITFLVDSSYSVQKARLNRSAEIINKIVSELSGENKVALYHCNSACFELSKAANASTGSAKEFEKHIKALRPLGSTSIDAVLEKMTTLAQGKSQQNQRFVYIGDGIASIGETDVSLLAEKARLIGKNARITTVSLGGENDELVLKSIASAGSGLHIPLTAGSSINGLAFRIISRQFGKGLHNVKVKLPEGSKAVSGADFKVLWPGEEQLIAFRFSGEKLEGDVEISGDFSGMEWKRTYKINMKGSTEKGNAFIPRVWAEKRITELQKNNDDTSRKEIVEISTSHHVLSRYTSLLVLESPAMAKAFGVKDTRPAVEWSGHEGSSSDETTTLLDKSTPHPASKGAGMGMSKRSLKMDDDEMESRKSVMSQDMVMDEKAPSAPAKSESMRRPPRNRRFFGRRRMIRMKKQWYRTAAIYRKIDSAASDWSDIQAKRAALNLKPESRDRMISLIRSLIRGGDLKEAEKLTEKWLEKDAMDAQALVTLSDIQVLAGDVKKAKEFLASAIDVDPSSTAAHTRMFNIYRTGGEFALMCAHALTRALLAPENVDYQISAVRCNQNKDRHFAKLSDRNRKIAQSEIIKAEKSQSMWGQLRLEMQLDGDHNADIVVVTPDGNVVSWLGGASRVSAASVNGSREEKLSISLDRNSKYRIWVVPSRTGIVRSSVDGRLNINSYGTTRSVKFTIGSAPVKIADVVIGSKFRLVPAP
ncbi:FecR domain-containing protein [Myxococcota bacterium]|nr:FecR domain-containing protein [Myxococcota bacterium]MBU1382984.1 FecR domain-containing protein [Myxococcota bacterium]MBU1499179.1 FecR domain-containing protein [Myxococcota bacterium]